MFTRHLHILLHWLSSSQHQVPGITPDAPSSSPLLYSGMTWRGPSYQREGSRGYLPVRLRNRLPGHVQLLLNYVLFIPIQQLLLNNCLDFGPVLTLFVPTLVSHILLLVGEARRCDPLLVDLLRMRELLQQKTIWPTSFHTPLRPGRQEQPQHHTAPSQSTNASAFVKVLILLSCAKNPALQAPRSGPAGAHISSFTKQNHDTICATDKHTCAW